MSDRYKRYTRLTFDSPADRVLRVTMEGPGKLNAADAAMHRELAAIWRDIDDDPEVSAVIITGARGVFSAGGDLRLVEDMSKDYATLMRVWREARDIVYNVINCSKPVISAIEGVAVGAGLAAGIVADISIVSPSTRIIDGHTRLGVAAGDHAVIIWPLLCGMAKSKYYLLTCDTLMGEEAERIGLVSLCVPDGEVQDRAVAVASKLANGAPAAVRFTKYALNNWLRSAGPAFDASTALEMLGFCGPDVHEGIASLREKRAPAFDPDSPVQGAAARMRGVAGKVVLVNNAGWERFAPFLETEPDLRDRIIAVNLRGPINLHHVVLKGMAARGGGRIVNIASDAGRAGSSGEAACSACKGGIVAFLASDDAACITGQVISVSGGLTMHG